MLDPAESIYHDDGIGEAELKYIHLDGREAVFNGDTLKPMTDPRYMATYNYVVIVEKPDRLQIFNKESRNDWLNFCYSYAGHFACDVLPYYLFGCCNTREQFENKIMN